MLTSLKVAGGAFTWLTSRPVGLGASGIGLRENGGLFEDVTVSVRSCDAEVRPYLLKV